MPNKNAASLLADYKRVLAFFVSSSLRPLLQRLDNESSTLLKYHICDEYFNFQLVPPDTYRRNPTKRTIRTLNNYFVAILASTDPD